jgi:hypothetical protein
MTLIPIGSIEAEIGALVGEDRTRAESLLQEASDLAVEYGKAWTETGGSDPAPVSVRLLVKRATIRAWHEDPDGYSEERLGDWSGKRPERDLDETGVFYTAGEIAQIRQAAGRRTAAQGSVRTPSAYGERGPLPDVYVGFTNAPGLRPIALLTAEDAEVDQ